MGQAFRLHSPLAEASRFPFIRCPWLTLALTPQHVDGRLLSPVTGRPHLCPFKPAVCHESLRGRRHFLSPPTQRVRRSSQSSGQVFSDVYFALWTPLHLMRLLPAISKHVLDLWQQSALVLVTTGNGYFTDPETLLKDESFWKQSNFFDDCNCEPI